MAKKTWELIVAIVEIALDVAILLKDKLSGGNHDSSSGNSKTK